MLGLAEMRAVLVVLVSLGLLGLFAPVLCDQDIYMGGFFLLSHYDDDDGLQHIASITGYKPDDSDFDDVFRGGVLSNYYVQPGGTTLPCYPNLIQSTGFGIVAAGDFAWVAGEYSNTVAIFDGTNWGPADDGIWTDLQQSTGGPSVDYITSTTDLIIFGGDFSYAEGWVVYCNQNNRTDVRLPGLVGYNPSSGEYAPLQGEDGPSSLATNAFITGLTSDGNSKVAFAYGSILFLWDAQNPGFAQLATDLNVQNGCLVYSNGYIYSLEMSGTDAILRYWSDTPGGNTFEAVVANYTSTNVTSTGFLLTEYEGGVAYGVPNPGATNLVNLYSFNIASNQSTPFGAPQEVPKQLLWPGSTNLWAVTKGTTASTENVWYYSNQLWQKVSTETVEYDIYSATVSNGQFYAYGRELENSTNKFFTLSVSGDYTYLSSGQFNNPGFVSAMAASVDEDSNLNIFVSGYFDYVGDGDNIVESKHFAVFSDDWDAIGYDYPINDLAVVNSTLYVIYFDWHMNSTSFPLDVYSLDSQDFVGFSGVLPTVEVSNKPAFVRNMYVDRDHNQIFFGGDFHAIVDGNDIYGVIGLNLDDMTWFGVDLPATSATQYTSYNAITTYDQAGDTYLFVGGEFQINDPTSGFSYTNAYLYDLTTMTAVQMNPSPSQEPLTSVISFDNSTLYISSIEDTESSVLSYNVDTGVWGFIGELKEDSTSLLTYVEGNSTQLFAGLGAYDGSAVGYGFATYNVSDMNAEWRPEGEESVLEANGISSTGTPYTTHFFIGGMNTMMFQGGGVVEPYYSTADFSSSPSSKHNGWWISLLVIGILLIVGLVIVGIAVGAFFVYKKKRTTYQEIMDA